MTVIFSVNRCSLDKKCLIFEILQYELKDNEFEENLPLNKQFMNHCNWSLEKLSVTRAKKI